MPHEQTPGSRDLQAAVLKDVATAQQTAEQSQEARGAPGAALDPSLRVRSIRVAGKVIAQKELADLGRIIKLAADQLVVESGLFDQVKKEQLRAAIIQRFQTQKTDLITRAGELKNEYIRRGLDAAKQAKLNAAIGGIVQSAAFIGVSQLGGGGGPTEVGTGAGAGAAVGAAGIGGGSPSVDLGVGGPGDPIDILN